MRSAQRSWRERRLASGLCLKCEDPRVNSKHCERHRQEHNASIRTTRQARRKAGRCRQCGEPSVKGSFCEPHRQAHNAQKAQRAS